MPSDTSRGFFLKSAVNVFASLSQNTKTYGKTNTFGGIWYARQIFSVIIIFLKTLFLGKIENAIIFQPKTSFALEIVDLENEDK